jgi:hypothetical protein
MTRVPAAVLSQRASTTRVVPTERAGSRAQHALPLAFLTLCVCGFYAPHLLGGSTQWDGLDVHFAAQRYFSDAVRSGHLPFWTPYVFGGFPFLADVQVGAWYPFNWPFFLLGLTPRYINAELLLHSLVACSGAYMLAMRLVGQPAGAVAAGLFYGLSGFFAAHSQHIGIFQTAAWLPWLVLALDGIGDRVTLRRLAAAGLLGAMLALPGHFQTALYAFSGAAVWAALDSLLTRRLDRARRVAAGLVAVGVWGAALAAVMIVPGLELVRQSVRTRLVAGDLNLGYFQLDSLFTLVLPNYFGVLVGSQYSGPGDVTQHYFYAGLLLLPLAVLGALSIARARWMALLLGLPFVWYALGPAAGLFNVVSQLPGFHNVELPMHGWFLPALGLALLGGAGLSRIKAAWVQALLIGVVFVDVLSFNALQNRLAFSRLGADELYAAPLRSLEAQFVSAQGPVERLHGPPLTTVGYRNHALQSRVETTYGYNPLQLALYADYQANAEDNPRLIDGLAATHLVNVHADRTATLEPNPDALPRAYFARRIRSEPDRDAALASLATLDPAVETLIVGPAPDVRPDPAASVSIVERSDDRLTLEYSSTTPNVLRTAIPWFPGWRAAANGTELQTLAVDYAFLGVVVPPGEGTIYLTYAPRWFWLGALSSSVALLATLVALVLPALLGMAKAKRTNVKAAHKDSAVKNTMNPPSGGGGTQEMAGTGMQAQDPKRRIGQHTGAGEPPIMKK